MLNPPVGDVISTLNRQFSSDGEWKLISREDLIITVQLTSGEVVDTRQIEIPNANINTLDLLFLIHEVFCP